MDKYSRFLLQKSEKPGHWVLTDQHNALVCIFENNKFNDTQKFVALNDNPIPDVAILARLVREMADFLIENHPEKI